MGPKVVNISAWCNSIQTGMSSSTHYYIALSPVYESSPADWEVRLYFTFGLAQWEHEEKTLEFTDSEREGVIGFQVTVRLDTVSNAILYCDQLRLTVS